MDSSPAGGVPPPQRNLHVLGLPFYPVEQVPAQESPGRAFPTIRRMGQPGQGTVNRWSRPGEFSPQGTGSDVDHTAVTPRPRTRSDAKGADRRLLRPRPSRPLNQIFTLTRHPRRQWNRGRSGNPLAAPPRPSAGWPRQVKNGLTAGAGGKRGCRDRPVHSALRHAQRHTEGRATNARFNNIGPASAPVTPGPPNPTAQRHRRTAGLPRD